MLESLELDFDAVFTRRQRRGFPYAPASLVCVVLSIPSAELFTTILAPATRRARGIGNRALNAGRGLREHVASQESRKYDQK